MHLLIMLYVSYRFVFPLLIGSYLVSLSVLALLLIVIVLLVILRFSLLIAAFKLINGVLFLFFSCSFLDTIPRFRRLAHGGVHDQDRSCSDFGTRGVGFGRET